MPAPDAAIDHIIRDEATLREIYGRPSGAAVAKQVDYLHPHYQSMIRAAPFAVLASFGPDGADATPRGDGPGFVAIQDEHTLLLPDRPVEHNLADNARMLAEETADTDGVVAIPGAPEFLASLRGLPHALVTSADEALATARMTAAGLELPDVSVTAESVGASTTDHEGFLKGAAELGVAPADCLVFEDAWNGVKAAATAEPEP